MNKPSQSDAPAEKHRIERVAISFADAAAAYGLSTRTLYQLHYDGKIATVKVGARRLIVKASIDRLFGVDGRLTVPK